MFTNTIGARQSALELAKLYRRFGQCMNSQSHRGNQASARQEARSRYKLVIHFRDFGMIIVNEDGPKCYHKAIARLVCRLPTIDHTMAPPIAQTIGLGTCSEHLQLMAMWNNLAILCLALANQSPDPAGSSLWNGPSFVLAWCARVEVPNAEAHLSVWLAESQQICAQHERRFRHTPSSKQLNSLTS